jgi:ABC-type branched-subunit amino acid transport system ATPase component
MVLYDALLRAAQTFFMLDEPSEGLTPQFVNEIGAIATSLKES